MPRSTGNAAGRAAAELLLCLRFYTALPLPVLPLETGGRGVEFGSALRFAPLIGALVGGIGCAVLLAGTTAGLPTFPAAILALLATVAVSGGLHEDGLADVADGFGGGRTRERKLDIMRDSRIGSYGGLAIGFSLLLRSSGVASLADHGGAVVSGAALIASAAASRGFGLLPMALLGPARTDGLAFGARGAGRTAYAVASGLALVLGTLVPMWGGFGWQRTGMAVILSYAGPLAVTALARRQIGGYTGDVAGAAQQVSETLFLLGLLFAPPLG